MTYARTGQWKQDDRLRGAEMEATVAQWLPSWTIDQSGSTDRLDFWTPGWVVECKAKNQLIGPRFQRLAPDVPEEFLFILDELSLRKGMTTPLTGGFPLVYFLLYSKPAEAWYLARVDELACCEKIRADRTGPTGVKKGKLLLDLRLFRRLANPSEDLMTAICFDIETEPWKQSACIGPTKIEEV